MSTRRWPTRLAGWFRPARGEGASPPPAGGVRLLERDVVLVIRAVVVVVLGYYLFGSGLAASGPEGGGGLHDAWRTALRTVQAMFFAYVALSVGTGLLLLGAQHLEAAARQALVFGVALLDAWFLAGIVALTGGADSQLYWLYPLLLLRNCRTLDSGALQMALNLLTILAYAAGAVVDDYITRLDALAPRGESEGALPPTDPFSLALGLGRPFGLRLLLLLVVAFWFQGLFYLVERERRAREEERELALRQEQLAASSRLAAEIAHQLKNPLAIINTASFTLQQTLREGKTITQQIQIIREEVAKSDRLITELMGYSQLVEGRVEKVDLKEALEAAINRVFPPAVRFAVRIERDYGPGVPELLVQRKHLEDVFVNLLQNARDLLGGQGRLRVRTRLEPDLAVRVEIEDDGPGVPPELRERIFEPYFSTREKGTGLGLAIVKHNVELYGGRVWVEDSSLGRGACFVLKFPARTLLRVRA